MVMTIPHEFEASLVRNKVGRVQLSINAEKGSAAGIVQSYAARILASYSVESGTELHSSLRAVGTAGVQWRAGRDGRLAFSCATGTTPHSTTGITWCRGCSWRW